MSAGLAWSEIERLFNLALARAPGERAAFLDGACHDEGLRREIDSLLLADAQADGFCDLARPAPQRIGPYRLLGKLGEGETSCVYLAERDDEQYRQHVAIKLIRPGMNSRRIVQRFNQERQILASLNHPHIARLLDGGTTAEGEPYFVMEYVEGEPLDIHCERRQLSSARRLELFVTVCQAVHFAHRNLVVHRDLKPSNILVDSNGTPKLLDFGIAKLLNPELVVLGVEATATVARVMTPHYASPEQVQGKPVSTASDVYSLGVVLYKLLTGQKPYEFTGASLQEVERVVCTAVPAAPSQLMRALQQERLPRDLDNIVFMAMRKEPERRYTSAQELADDLGRCLERRPVLARRDTLGYRLSSFIRRNPGGVAAAALIFLLLVGGIVATTWQWRRAVAERARTQQALDFLVELFKIPDSHVAVGDVPARELLDRGAARLQAQGQRRPDVAAALKHTLGVVYRNVGAYPQASALLEEAVQARTQLPGAALDLADSLYQLGAVNSENGKPYLAQSQLRQSLALRRAHLPADDLLVADSLHELANADISLNPAAAEDGFRRALEIRRQKLGADDPRLLPSLGGLGAIYARDGRYAEAEKVLGEAMVIRNRALGNQQCQLADDTLNSIALLKYNQGYFADAERYIDAAIHCLQRDLGPDHVQVVDVTSWRIAIWREQGRFAEAEELARSSLAARRALHGDGHPAVDNALGHLASVLYERGKLGEAEQLATTALAMREARYGRNHESVAESLMLLGDIRLAEGDAAAAESAQREALAFWRRTTGEDLVRALDGVAAAAMARGGRAEARQLASEALAIQRQRLRHDHPQIADTLTLVGSLVQDESAAAAEPVFRDALAIREAALGREHPHTARAEILLGGCLAQQKKMTEALPLLRHGFHVSQTQLGDAHAQTREALQRLREAESRR